MALHCPALIVVVALADEASVARAGARLVELLSEERIAAVYATDARVAEATAAGIADRLGLPPPSHTAGSSGAAHDIADLHRGETVLLLDRAPEPGRDGWWAQAVGGSVTGPGAHPGAAAPTADPRSGLVDIVRLEVGDDGSRVLPAGPP